MKHRLDLSPPTRAAAVFVLASFTAGCSGSEPAPPAPATAAVPAADPAAAAREKLVARGKSLELPTNVRAGARRRAVASHLGLRQDDVLGGVHDRLRRRVRRRARRLLHRRPTRSARRSASRSSTRRRRRSASRCPTASTRTAVYTGSQGCVTYPEGSDKLSFTPKTVQPNLPSAGAQDWPMGDRLPKTPFPAELDEAKIKSAVDAAFAIPDAETTAFVVTWKGRADRRALRRGHHHDHAARELVDGQERDLDDHGHADPARASTRSTSRRRFPSGRAAERPARADQDPGHPADVERHPHHLAVRSRLRPEGPVPGSPVPLHGRRRRLQIRRDAAAAVAAQHRRAATATPIRC